MMRVIEAVEIIK